MKPYLLLALLIGGVSSGCTETRQLSRHPLDDRSVAVTADIPDAPFVDFNMTIFDRVGTESPISLERPPAPPSGLEILGGMLQKDKPSEQHSEARALIDSVLIDWSMSDKIVDFVLAKGAQQLRYTPTASEEAAYRLVAEIDDYGIGADDWTSPLYFEIMGRLTLVDNKSGRRIWRGEIYNVVPVQRALAGAGVLGENASTPAQLADKSLEEMRNILIGLSSFAAESIIAPLVEGYWQSTTPEMIRVENRQTTL